MANWRVEYIAALTARDQSEKANLALYNACKLFVPLLNKDQHLIGLQTPSSQIVPAAQQLLHQRPQKPNEYPLPKRACPRNSRPGNRGRHYKIRWLRLA